jgi:nitrile hydratase accessory protein
MTDLPKDRVQTETPGAMVPDPADAVFAEPWEARAFALALNLSSGGQFSWNEFRDRLIAEIAEADTAAIHDHSAGPDSPHCPYYECWLAALEKLLREKALLNGDEIERRAATIAASPAVPIKVQGRGPIKVA